MPICDDMMLIPMGMYWVRSGQRVHENRKQKRDREINEYTSGSPHRRFRNGATVDESHP